MCYIVNPLTATSASPNSGTIHVIAPTIVGKGSYYASATFRIPGGGSIVDEPYPTDARFRVCYIVNPLAATSDSPNNGTKNAIAPTIVGKGSYYASSTFRIPGGGSIIDETYPVDARFLASYSANP